MAVPIETKPRKLKMLDLFSGIGGFSLGLERTNGFETVAFCEIEPYPQAVLRKHWPNVPIYDDIRTLTAERLKSDGISVDVITGGFPCQDLSVAGKQAGIDGERSGLWKELCRIISEVRPQYAIVENVPTLLSGDRGRWFGRVLGDLAEIGYDTEWHCIPASAIGAPHRRDRIWIIARCREAMADTESPRFQTCYVGQREIEFGRRNCGASQWSVEPDVGRVANGVSAYVDRLTSLGNAVVPQIPQILGEAILQAEEIKNGQ